jgi:hypothetical protein
VHTKFRLENLKGRDHLRGMGTGGRKLLKSITGKEVGSGTGVIWFRKGFSGVMEYEQFLAN